MNKNYNLKLDLQFRCNNSIMKFNQFDNNTSDFFMRITNGGNLVDIEKALVVLAVIKPSGKVASQFVEVKNGLVYADLKPSMKDEIGTYTAKAMLILEDKKVVTNVISYEVEEDKIFSLLNDSVETTEEFTLLTDMLSRLSTIEISEEQRMINEAERILSEENRKIEEAKRVEAELVRQHEEADRTKYDATRESNENIRKQNESIRLANETNRIDEEAKRVEEEDKRKLAEEERNANYNFMTEDEERRRSEANAHKEAEVLRVQAETNRVNEEAKRRTTEQGRVSAENIRVSNENVRETNELARKNNETQRVEAETQRKNRYNSFIADAEANASNFENYTNNAKAKEEERKANELDRKSQETQRVSNENERLANEETRKANEVVREENETSRQNVFENKVSEVDEKIVELNTTKDNFVSSINTKVDNKISEIEVAKSDMTTTVSNKINEVENRFNALTSKQQQDAEVIDARDGETSLKARLDRDIEKAKQVYVNVEGSNISTDSSVGYAKDVEILGNTIQDASNLADIRSVGDTVEGQELYEIPVLSVGKNLFDHNIFKNEFLENQRIGAHGGHYSAEGFTTLKGFKEIPKFWFNKTLIHNFVGCIAFYSDTNDGSLISRCYQDKTYAVPQNARYFRFEYQNYKKDEFQLEEGTVATPYEPYVEDKLTILSPVQLEKVGDVADRITCKDGVWGVEKNIRTILLDGSESGKYAIESSSWYDDTTYAFHYKVSGYNISVDDNSKQMIICDKLISNSANYVMHNDKSTPMICGHSNGFAIFRLKRESLDDFTQGSLCKFLSSNNMCIKYPTTQPQFIPLPHDQQVKLRTFANKTNISFLTEIEGTIKAQVPKSLGATVNTHTEQISNLNKELDRVKKLEESTVSTVETESDFTTVEATSNGYFEDVKLEGKTLVNLASMQGAYIRKDTGNVLANGNVPLLQGLKANTTYTRIINVSKLNLGTIDRIRMYDSLTDVNGVYKQYPWSYITTTGVYMNTFTIGDADTTPIYRINPDTLAFNGTTGVELEIDKMVILEGDHTQNPPSYFEGLKSAGDGTDEIVVSSVKGDGNLFDGKSLSDGYIDNGVPNNWNSHFKTDFIRVEGNTVYFSEKFTPIQVAFVFAEYDINKNFIRNSYIYEQRVGSFTTHSDCAYIRITSAKDSLSMDELSANIKLYKNSMYNTQHQSDKKRLLYYNEETQAWEKPILRQWDSVEKHADGKYYYHQRSGEVVLNGSEGWSVNQAFSTGDYIACMGNSVLPNKKRGLLNVISDKFNTKNCASIPVLEEGAWGEADNSILYISISKSKLSTQDVQGFKQWLQANNVTVVYQLAQEKVYECTNIDLITYANETNYIVECGAISPKSTLKVHNNISNVVNLLQKKVSLLESNITSYMITQNRLMLASRYNADTVSFKVDVATLRNSFEYDNDLYELILNNVLVGKDNYNREYIENLIIFYWMDFILSDEMYSTLFEIIEEQHNPKIEEKETPLI